MRVRNALVISLLAPLVWSCGQAGRDSEGSTLRLVDLFADARIEASPTGSDATRTEWRFDDDAQADPTWEVGGGVKGMRIADGVLAGTSTPPSPVLKIAWQAPQARRNDKIHSVEVRMKASAGRQLSFATSNDEELQIGPFLAPGNPFGWSMSTPLIPGEEASTYLLRPVQPVPAADIHHLLIRPTEAPGSDFAIESIRVIFEREHLSNIPSGINWQGLRGVYRETIVSRSPETVTFDAALPERAWLDLNVGTLQNGAVTFQVTVAPASGEPRILRHTVTQPQRWEDFGIALDELSGSDVEISLSLEADAGVLGLWGSPAIRSRVPDPSSPQGVIVVLMDTLRRDHLAMYGHDRDTAPLLSRLASEGVLVEDPISQATWTKVSVPSIFTSLYPTSHTIEDLPDLLPASAVTMAEVFREAGYATLGISAIPFTGKMTNLHQGYEEFHESGMDVATGGVPEKSARRHVDKLLPWLDAHRDVPFFVFLHVEDPHSPYYAPSPYETRWGKAGDVDKYREMQETVRPKIDSPLMRQFGMPRTEDLAEVELSAEEYVAYELDAYDGLIRAMDAEIQRLVDKLDSLGLSDDVVLAFVSDHGTEFLDHDAHFHGQSVYGELNRIPMFLWSPGFIPAGVTVPGTVETIDLMPTVLEIAGLEIPAAVHGQSLVPWFDAGGDETAAGQAGWRRQPAITEKASLPFRGADGFASTSIVFGGWKLIRNLNPSRGLPEIELFDHLNDPLNLDNVADEHAEIVASLLKQLDQWQQFAEAGKLQSDAEMAEAMSPEELKRLRSLGYL